MYRLPEGAAAEAGSGSWADLPARGRSLGRVPVAAVTLDPTRRRYVDDAVFSLLPEEPPAGADLHFIVRQMRNHREMAADQGREMNVGCPVRLL